MPKAKGSQKVPLHIAKAKDESSSPGLKKPSSLDESAKTQYSDAQRDEILVLESIWGEDFVEHKAANTAWKRSEPSFDIHIRASSDEDFTITLGVVLTATYPRSIPLLSLKDNSNLGESTLFKLQKFIATKPKTYVAQNESQNQTEPFIHDIASGVQDILEDAAQARAQGLILPSLEEERAAHEAEVAKQAQKEQAAEDRKKQEAKEEEERVMQSMIEEELKRQRAKEKESRKRNKPQSMALQQTDDLNESEASKITFDQLCRVTDFAGNDAYFTAVTGKAVFRQSLIGTVYTVRPLVGPGQACPLLALKELELHSDSQDLSQFKKQLLSLEKKLESVKKLDHQNIVKLIDFRIDRHVDETDSSSQSRIVRVLTPLADKGPLEELLDLTGQLAIGKVRSWTTDLLAALGYMHSQGLIHEDIHPSNILLFREESGHVVPKFADTVYQRELHAICRKSRTISSLDSARSAYWLPPEIAGNSKSFSQKTDVWDFGVVFLQMIFGLDVFEKYQSPSALMDTLSLSRPLRELVSKFFKADPGKRPRANDLRSSEFLATEAPILADDAFTSLSPSQSFSSLPQAFSRKRLDSSTQAVSFSRYKNEFYEEGRLGKGGFGEVVKARKKIDGQIYAIKKITTRASRSLTTTLTEVRMLAQLSHPAIVRYYDAWIEQVFDSTDTDVETSTEGGTVEDVDDMDDDEVDYQVTTSTRGLDFMSSANPAVDFGYEESESEDEDDSADDAEEDDDAIDDEDLGFVFAEDSHPASQDQRPITPRRLRSQQKPYKNCLYILMEYCEKRTLRDLISQNLYQNTEEIWRLFREILEGLVHIHGLHNVVHRDLKPENIFIRSTDGVPHVKIGDFGLATSGHVQALRRPTDNVYTSELSNVGTPIYLAPELEKSGTVDDSRKIDMYALGIIFFEMSYKPMIAHERQKVLSELRGQPPHLPEDFQPSDKMQTEIILSLVTHNPKERPSSSDLLRSGKLPMPLESESIQRALADISDPSSPHYSRLVATLFARTTDKMKDYTWDMSAPNPSSTELLQQSLVKDELTSIFRRHGAVEATRNPLYPRSPHYTQSVVELLDHNGTVVQLPYDLMMGHARVLAKQTGSAFVPKSFTFGSIYRSKNSGGQPPIFGEVGFDIVSTDSLDIALKEAEVIKVLDEIIDAFPSLTQMCFHVGHSDLLQLIFDFCNIDRGFRRPAAEVLSKLNIYSWTWQKIRTELRQIGLSVTSIDELQRFDFRDVPSKAFQKLKAILESSNMFEKAQSPLAHLKDVIAYTKRFGVRRKIYVNPLSSFREDFFQGGILFQCVYDKKHKDVFAAGGRYDSLIREHRPKIGNLAEQRRAVGFSLSWERLARIPKSGGKAFLKKTEAETQSIFSTKRCDVLVASFDTSILRSAGVELLKTLWSHDISAELARDSRSPEDLLTKHRDESYSWVIMIKQDSVLKIKTMDRKDIADAEVPSTQLLPWLRTEMRERDRHSTSLRQTTDTAILSSSTTLSGGGVPVNQDQDVKVLVAGTKSKKFNRRVVVEQAQANAAALVRQFLDGPIAAIEASDTVLDLIGETTLSDAESWRKAEQSVNMVERKYVREIHDMLLSWRDAERKSNGRKHAFVYNFRTTKCIYYDLSA